MEGTYKIGNTAHIDYTTALFANISQNNLSPCCAEV